MSCSTLTMKCKERIRGLEKENLMLLTRLNEINALNSCEKLQLELLRVETIADTSHVSRFTKYAAACKHLHLDMGFELTSAVDKIIRRAEQ